MGDIDKILTQDLVENVASDAKPTENETASTATTPSSPGKPKPQTETEKLISKTLTEQKAKERQEYLDLIKARALIDYYIQRSREKK